MKNLKNLALGTLLAILCLWPTSWAMASYDDVPQNHPSFQSISYLELQGVLDDGRKFRPDDPINRAEFYKMIFKTFGETAESVKPSVTFTDVSQNAWFAPYVELALKYDLIESYPRIFQGDKSVSRIEAVKQMFRLFNVASPIIPVENRVDLYSDVSVAHPKYSLIHRAVSIGIVEQSKALRFEAYSKLTRGEMADLLFAMDQWAVSQMGDANENLSDVHKSEILADVWERIMNNFYIPEDMKIDEEALFQAAVKGMIQSLDDPYSIYVPPAASDAFTSTLTGEFEGIGVYLIQDEVNGKYIVTDFVPNSNAKEVGMMAGDEILEVDGVDVLKLSLEELVLRIKGPAGTTVKIKVMRNGSTHSFEIERRLLKIISETSKILNENLWYLDINLFSISNFIDVNAHLQALEQALPEPKAIVIDLRGNGGGFINTALSIVGHFVPNSEPVVKLDYGNYQETIHNKGRGEYGDSPIYVLVDRYTASAAEIVAAALREQNDAILIGETTFGKGTAQQVTTYWDGSILKLTIAQWLTSEGLAIQGVGLEPDILIEEESTAIDWWLEEVEKLVN